MYGQPGQAQLLNQMMQVWKDTHRMRLGQIVEGCTSKYTIWREHKIEDAVPLSAIMRVLIPNPVPIQPSKVEIIKLEFASERLEIEKKYLRLEKIANKAKSNARIHERKAQRMTDVYTKTKSENENLYIANKKLWGQVKDTKIRRFFLTQRREGEASQRESNHWQTQTIEAQTKVNYLENEHSVVFKELLKCRKSQR